MKQSLLSLLLAALPLAAATAQTPLLSPPKMEFLDSTLAALPSAAGAHYWREVEYNADSTAGVKRIYYLSGQLREHTTFDYGPGTKKHVLSKLYDEAGRLLQRSESSQNHYENAMYYPSGQLKRHESYHYGVFGRRRRECFAPDGTHIPYFEYEIPPRYPEGNGQLLAVTKAVRRSIQYPADALRMRFEGRVFLAFTIAESGAVENVRVVRPLLPSLDAEAVRAFYTLRRFEPGRLDGKPRKVTYVVPFDFRLE